MLVYQVEVIKFSQIFLENIMSSIQLYLFVQRYLNLTNRFFLPVRKNLGRS